MEMDFRLVTVISTFLSISQIVSAKDFKSIEKCGSAKVVSGDTCSNVKVEFTFDGCAIKAAPQVAKRVICEGQRIKARYQEGNYRYEAEFNKVDDGWGGVTWNSLGPVKQFEKEVAAMAPPKRDIARVSPSDAVAATTIATPTPVPAVAVVVPPTPASAMKVAGFFDARYSTLSMKNSPAGSVLPHGESGFLLEDGAVYANYDKDRLAVVVDIAIRRSLQYDLDLDTTNPRYNQSNTNNIGIGVRASQLYIKYKITDNIVVDFGQFDTIFGVELNDSKDRIFGKTGLVYDTEIPVTHDGAMIEYATHGAYGKFFAANPNNKGSNGTSSTGDEGTEYGAALGYSNDYIRGQAGYMSRPISTADLSGRANRSLLDFTAGASLGKFSIDLEYAIVADPSKNTLSSADLHDSEKAGSGFLALGSYKITDDLLVGGRFEALSNDPGSNGFKSATSYGASVHYRIHSNLEARTEFIGYNYQNPTGVKWNAQRFSVGAVVTF
jgi:hypothetical protein